MLVVNAVIVELKAVQQTADSLSINGGTTKTTGRWTRVGTKNYERDAEIFN